MKRLFLFNAKIYEILPQVGAKLPQVVAKLPQAITEPEENRPQLVDELFSIPWGHIRLLIDNCKNNPQKALFYIRKTMERTDGERND